jgi:predicted peptidase
MLRWILPPAIAAILLLSPPDSGTADPTPFSYREAVVSGRPVRYAVWLPPDYDASRSWPAIVFLHGAGESGTDGEKPTHVGLGPALRAWPDRWPFVVLFPQKPSAEEEWEEREEIALAVLGDAMRAYRIDRERVTLSGISQGGHGTWYIAARHPERWAALVPVCGYGRARTIAGRIDALPVWAFHGLRDDLVLPEDTRQIMREIRARRATARADTSRARVTLYPEANHNAWDPAYAEAELPRWIAAQRRAPRTDAAR